MQTDSITTSGRVRFGGLEVDLSSHELLRSGRRVRLQQKSFLVLSELLKNSGRVVTREELAAALWPKEHFVDSEHGLNTAVRRLREALGDAAEEPRFIETVPKLGYRFIAAIEEASAEAAVETPVTAAPRTDATRPSRRARLLAAALAGALALAGIAVVALRSRTARSRSVSSNPAVEELLARSRFLRNHKRFAESKQFVEEALRLDPKNPNALAGLSLNVLADGRQDEARELALRAIELDPNAWEAYRTLGNYARMAGDMNGAERHLRRAVDANPRDFKGRNRLARLLLELGKLEEARGQMLESKRLAPDDADVQDIWIGYSLRTGDYEEAIRLGKIWFTMWEKHPEGLMSPVLRDQVALANVGARRYEEAQALFKSIDPQDDLRVALTLGFAGRAAEARTMLAAREARSAASGSPLDPQTAGALAMASIAVGDFDRAFGHLDRQVSAGAFPGWLNCALFDPIRRHPRWPAFQERLDREFFRGKERKAPFPRPDEGWPRPKERGTAS